jgi:hypothetical protein
MGFARLVNSGRVTKFISAAHVAGTGAHIFVCRKLPAWAAQSPFLVCGECGRSTWSRNWSVARAMSALTLRQCENALSQINSKGIGVSVGSLLLRELGGEIRTMAWALAAEAASVFP